MTALTIVQGAASRLGLAAPSAVFSSTDQQTIQMRNLMNQEGRELSKRYPWTKLITEKTFTTAAQAVQTSAVPADFGWYLNNTMWNRSTDRPIHGPMSEAEWQREQAVATSAAMHTAFRFRGGNLLWYPSPTAGETGAYEYVSKNWAEASDGAGGTLAAMTADANTSLLEEELITLGVVWRFLNSKGFDYAEAFRTYQMEVSQAIARDGGRRTYALHGPSAPNFMINTEEGNWTL